MNAHPRGFLSMMRRSERGRSVSRLVAQSLAVLLVAAAPIGSRAAPFLYVSQSGMVSAGGYTTSLGTTTQQFPISGIEDVDLVAFVEEGDPEGAFGTPPGYYTARGELRTTLGSHEIHLDGTTEAYARWDGQGIDEGDGTFASAHADVTILLDLASPTRIRLEGTGVGAQLIFMSLDSGFQIFASLGEIGIDSCGSLSVEECDALVDSFLPEGALIPAGSYRLVFELFAFQPFSSCSVGCNFAEGGGSLFALPIPEPGTAMLVIAGLLGLGSWRRAHP